MRKVDAIGAFRPSAEPTNKAAAAEYKGDLEIADRMDLHRALMRGNGFYEWMTGASPGGVEGPAIEDAMAQLALDQQPPPSTPLPPLGSLPPSPLPRPLRPLPVVNLLDIPEDKHVGALLEEALPHDREPFRRYMSSRSLGVGIITAAPGFGKTTLLAIAGLAMHASLGKILVSAPSNVAVDNIAHRIHKIGTSVATRYNEGKAEDDPSRVRRPLVIRVYHFQQERSAILSLLEHPDRDVTLRQGKSPWNLELSIAYWFLVLLGSPAKGIKQLEADDSEALHELRRDFNARGDLANMRAVVAREMSWAEFKKDDLPDIKSFMKEIVLRAELLCTTPARSADDRSPCLEFKQKLARGVLIDEAANMNMADYYCVAGNILMPCVLGGDPKQLKPVVPTGNEKDADGNLYHRFADDGTVSALAFLQGSGIPVYRLTMQLRMAEGLFDWVAEALYPEVPFQYAAQCNIFRPYFAAGRALEARARARFPEIAPAPLTGLRPLFLHCPGSRVHVDKVTKSKLCPVQVKATLDFALDLVQNTEIKATNIVILCPYAANVHLVGNIRKRPAYAGLLEMPPASTVDSYQGQESDIVLVTMGTAFPRPGPGFTTDENRLCVLLTRQRCGLVIVGDVNVDAGLRGKEKPKAGMMKVINPDGKVHWMKAKMLHTIYTRVVKENRVMRLPEAPAGNEVVEGPAA
ncbi:P-loop containing nucleoside triphosphate hydrolase protein [Chaetomium sp. MPI-CAGE-AT-0009]|nr:P-loop containing nucleoside triphosphate hydrolase protein [Chaetomium sp. MPI-CAGE-AT-0009]